VGSPVARRTRILAPPVKAFARPLARRAFIVAYELVGRGSITICV
jgi:hypothetical protein